jgi:lysozyme
VEAAMDIDALISDLERDEDRRHFPYVDTADKITIGVGRNLTDKGISGDEIATLLENDIREVIASLNHALPWWTQLSEVRQRVLANLCFNVGAAGLLSFKRMLGAAHAGAYDVAADEMLDSDWAEQVGIGTPEHPGRALRLANMMRTGIDPNRSNIA